MDSEDFLDRPDSVYLDKAYCFLSDAVSQGWMNMPKKDSMVEVIKIKQVSLPIVPLDASGDVDSLGKEWVEYLNDFKYNTLKRSDFEYVGNIKFGPDTKSPIKCD